MERVYRTFNYASAKPHTETLVTGIRTVVDSEKDGKSAVYISATYVDPKKTTHALIYKGYLPSNEPCDWHLFNYPSACGRTVTGTAFYGPNNGPKKDTIQAVGNYNTEEGGKKTFGCLYEGPLDGSGKWRTIQPPGKNIIGVIVHSTMGGLAVGNYQQVGKLPRAFIYDIKNDRYHKINLPKDGVQSITAYGIWHNGGDSYTICGGYTTFNQIKKPKDSKGQLDPSDGSGRFVTFGYVAELDREIWRIEEYEVYSAFDKSIVSHFNGITTDSKCGYNLTGDSFEGGEEHAEAFFAHIKSVGSRAKWSPVNYPKSSTTSGNSVDQEVVIGVYKTQKGQIESYISQPK